MLPLPWSQRPWALSFLTLLAPSEAAHQAVGRRHRSVVDWTGMPIRWVSRWRRRRWVLITD